MENEMLKQLNLDSLNHNQRAFVAAFRGDPIEAARTVLPNGTKQQQYGISHRMMNNPEVRKNLQVVRDSLFGSAIADTHEVLLYWSETMRDINVERKDRTRCSELLGKFHGLLNEKLIIDNRKVVLNLVQELGALLPHEQEVAQKALEQAQQELIDLEPKATHSLTVADLL